MNHDKKDVKVMPLLFPQLYRGDASRSEIPGYNPPGEFEHGKRHLVAALKAEPDGYDVEVYECRLPARFYRIVALPTKNSVGEERPGFSLETGSGCDGLVAQIARAIADGMLGLGED